MTLDPLYVRCHTPTLYRGAPKRDLAYRDHMVYRRVYQTHNGPNFDPDGNGVPVSRDEMRDSIRLVPLVPVQLDWSI